MPILDIGRQTDRYLPWSLTLRRLFEVVSDLPYQQDLDRLKCEMYYKLNIQPVKGFCQTIIQTYPPFISTKFTSRGIPHFNTLSRKYDIKA